MTTHTAKLTQRSANGLTGSNQPKTDAGSTENAGDNRHRKKLWLAALKPPMYCVAIAPICIGSAVAYRQTGQFNLGAFALFMAAAVLLLVWENLSNDVFDAATGIDKNKHHSRQSHLQSPPHFPAQQSLLAAGRRRRISHFHPATRPHRFGLSPGLLRFRLPLPGATLQTGLSRTGRNPLLL